MKIGDPIRTIEVRPSVLPVPEPLDPDVEPEPADEPEPDEQPVPA